MGLQALSFSYASYSILTFCENTIRAWKVVFRRNLAHYQFLVEREASLKIIHGRLGDNQSLEFFISAQNWLSMAKEIQKSPNVMTSCHANQTYFTSKNR